MKLILVNIITSLLIGCHAGDNDINQISENRNRMLGENMKNSGIVDDPFLNEHSAGDDNVFSEIKIGADKEDFLIIQTGQASLSNKQITLIGRLQVYVKNGSQYAIWRQFPRAIYFEVIDELGNKTLTPDPTRSISDHHETYKRYASMPADQIVGKNFELNIYQNVHPIIAKAGRYQIRARYFGKSSNWVEVKIDP